MFDSQGEAQPSQSPTDSLRFLTETALEFLELPPEADIWRLIATRTAELVGDTIVLVNSYDDATRTTETKIVSGFSSVSKRLMRLLGRDPVGLRLAINEDATEKLRSGKVEPVDGIHGLSFGRLPRTLCAAIEELINLGQTWAIGFSARGELLGSLCLLQKRGARQLDASTVEAFVYQAAVALLRRRAEKARNESEEIAAFAFAASPDSVLIARLSDGAVLEVNQSFLKSLGYSREEILGHPAAEIRNWQQRDDFRRFYGALVREGEVTNFETVFRSRAGELMNMLVSARIIEMGGERCVLSIARDISDRKRFEEELRASRDTYRTIFENKGTATIIVENDGTVSLANSKALELWGVTRDEVEGKRKWTEFASPATIEHLKAYRALRETTPESTPQSVEFVGIRSDGESRNVIATMDAIPGQDKIVASFLDVTELKMAHDELQRAAKLESLGLLAGGIAHDFNNLLGALLGNLSLARDVLESGGDVGGLAGYLQESEKAVLRARDLTQQLLTFSKGGAPVKRVASLAAVIEDSVHFVLSGSRHQAVLDIDPALRATNVDPGQISQVIQNLVLNAAQSMTEPGIITVTAANESIRPNQGWLPLPPGDYVRLRVIDQGCGIQSADLPRVFDPFFTTRPDMGSGLGLSTAYRIVKQHDGSMTVESSPGRGSAFTFYLPAVDGEETASASGRIGRIHSGTMVLVVDDEEHLRDVVARMLTRLGCTVSRAPGADQGYSLYEEARDRGKPFDLVITDLTMPGGAGGVELAERILALDPSARIVATSGYATDDVMSDYKEWGFVERLPKPFSLAELGDLLTRLEGSQS
jgi:two-component system, cell cycle sensor histidine kinase and response regulator CckA